MLRIIAIIVFFIYIYTPIVNPKTKQAYACAYAADTIRVDGNCILFDIECEANERIRIKKALYGFRESYPADCETNEEVCRQKGGCCTGSKSDPRVPFNTDHTYDIYKACSWQTECKKQTAIGTNDNKQDSVYSLIEYNCQNTDRIAHFCPEKASTVSGESINIIFNGSNTDISDSAECSCTIETTGDYKISAPDLRLQSAFQTCSSEANITGLDETPIICSTKLINIIGTNRDSSGYLKLSFKLKPEFIWVLIKGKGRNDNISVTCVIQTDAPTMTTKATSFRTINTTSSTPTHSLISSTINTQSMSTTGNEMHSTYPHNTISRDNSMSPTTTAIDANQSRVFVVDELNSETVPVAAMIVPVVLVLVFAGVGILFWRKWCRGKRSFGKPGNLCNQETIQESSQKTYNDYVKTHTLNEPLRAADNYIVLEQENTYTYIDPGKLEYTALPDDGRMQSVHAPNYFILEPVGKRPHNERGGEEKVNETPKRNDSDTCDTVGERNDYFVLESQRSDEITKKKAAAISNNKTDAVEGHSYFTLESQYLSEINSVDDRKQMPMKANMVAKEKLQNQDYIEQQNTYASIDDDDVNIQTMPDNEYNVISFNTKIHKVANENTANGESNTYTHIQNMDNVTAADYSHIKLTSKKILNNLNNS